MTEKLFSTVSIFRPTTQPPDVENNIGERDRCSGHFSDITSSRTELLSSRNFTSSTRYSLKSNFSASSVKSPTQPLPSHCSSYKEAPDDTVSDVLISSSLASGSFESSSSEGNADESFATTSCSSLSSSMEYYEKISVVSVCETTGNNWSPPKRSDEFFNRRLPGDNSFNLPPSTMRAQQFCKVCYRPTAHHITYPRHSGRPPSIAERFRRFPSLSQMRSNTICIDIPEESESQLATTTPLVSPQASFGNVLFEREVCTAIHKSESHIETMRLESNNNSSSLHKNEHWLTTLWNILSNIGSLPYSPSRRRN